MKKESVGEIGRMYEFGQVHEMNEKKYKSMGHVNKRVKEYQCCKKNKTNTHTQEYGVDIMLKRKKRKLKRELVKNKYTGLVENRSRPRMWRTS